MARLSWLDRCVPAKVGTMPMMVYVHAADRRRLKVGNWARVQYHENGSWERVLVTRVDPDGYFMANK